MRGSMRWLLGMAMGVMVLMGGIQTSSAYTIVNGTFTDPAGLTFGTLTGGSDGGGYTPDPTNYGYFYTGMIPGYGDVRDWNWCP